MRCKVTSSIIRSGNLTIDAKPGTSCDYHRLTLPYSRLEDANVSRPTFVFNRQPSAGPSVLYAMRSSGVRIIADVDDLPELDTRHYLYDAFRKNGSTRSIVESLQLADVVTCTTQYLADQLMARYDIHAKRIVVIPNALPFDSGQFVRNQSESDTTFVYAAGASHYRDSLLIPAGRADVTFAGYQSNHPEWAKIQSHHIGSHFKPQRALSDYMSVYEGHSCALAPLTVNVFNACKSNLKVLEAGCAGIPVLASSALPYLNDFDRGCVVFAGSPEEWKTRTFQLAMSESIREDFGTQLAQHVRRVYHLDNANKIRRQLLESP